MCVNSLATPFPLLYFTSPWLFYNYLLVLLNPLTSSLIHLFPLPSVNLLVTNFFSLAFKSLSLSLTFGLLIMMFFGVGLLTSIIIEALFVPWTYMSISFTKSGKFSFIIFSDRFPISCSFFFWHSYEANVGTLKVVPEAVYTILIVLDSFSSYCSV